MKAHFLAADVATGFAEIHLRMARAVHQWHEDFLAVGGDLVDVTAHPRIAPGKAMFIVQPFQNAHFGVALLHMDLFIGFQNGIDDVLEWGDSLGDIGSALR